MVGHHAGKALKPKGGNARKDLSFIGNLVGQNKVIGADTIACYHKQALTAVVDVANLAPGIGTFTQ